MTSRGKAGLLGRGVVMDGGRLPRRLGEGETWRHLTSEEDLAWGLSRVLDGALRLAVDNFVDAENAAALSDGALDALDLAVRTAARSAMLRWALQTNRWDVKEAASALRLKPAALRREVGEDAGLLASLRAVEKRQLLVRGGGKEPLKHGDEPDDPPTRPFARGVRLAPWKPPAPRRREEDAAARAAQGPLERLWSDPLVRVVGQDIEPTFLHGTHPEVIPKLTRPRPKRFRRGSDCDEFAPNLYLSDPHTPHQAVAFGCERGDIGRALAVVELRPGSLVLDLSDEAARRPPRHKSSILPGEPSTLAFFSRPAITDDLVAWMGTLAHQGYPWSEAAAAADPALPTFDIVAWEKALVPFARSRGWHAVRLADETLLVAHSAILSARKATPSEIASVRKARVDSGRRLLGNWYTAGPSGVRREVEARRAAAGAPGAAARPAAPLQSSSR